MVYIFYTCSDKKLNIDIFSYYLKSLPSFFQTKILKYRHWEDAQRSLLGKTLLINGLHYLGLKQYLLKDLKFSEFKKPYFDDCIDFNISHSGEFIICAICLTGKVGVDVEEIKPLLPEEFKMYFSHREWKEIEQSPDCLNSFYKYWTQKEAFLKAIGMGLSVPINKVEISGNSITWKNSEWLLHEIKLDKRYIAHLAGNIPLDRIIVEKIRYD